MSMKRRMRILFEIMKRVILSRIMKRKITYIIISITIIVSSFFLSCCSFEENPSCDIEEKDNVPTKVDEELVLGFEAEDISQDSIILESIQQEVEKQEEIPEDELIFLNPEWMYADSVAIYNDGAMLYRAQMNRKNIIIAVDAGHGTTGASGLKLYCHPDHSQKTTGGSSAAGSIQINAQSGGMTFRDGTQEGKATFLVSSLLKDFLIAEGYDVLMLRDAESVELDLLARTIIANYIADCHISIHFDGDGLDYDKGAFYISVPEGIKNMPPVDTMWELHDKLGDCLIEGLIEKGVNIYKDGSMSIDLMQTSYSTIPSVDLELGNQCTELDDERLSAYVEGIAIGVDSFFESNETK